jgi:hypothetical protein
MSSPEAMDLVTRSGLGIRFCWAISIGIICYLERPPSPDFGRRVRAASEGTVQGVVRDSFFFIHLTETGLQTPTSVI